MNYLIIDSGATGSRVRWYDGERIAGSVRRQAGARDVAKTGSNLVVKEALKDAINELLASRDASIDDIDAIIASGMISSNLGLIEIPHIPGPVDLPKLASGLVAHEFPDVAAKPVWFVPGVKTGFGNDASAAWEEKDMMRGEEAEIFGYMDSLSRLNAQSDAEHGVMARLADKDILFMHYGGHHKAVLLQNGQISKCRTSITGELTAAVSENTILKSSLLSAEEIRPDYDWVKRGVEAAEQAGFGRALFSTRVLQAMEGLDKQKASSFYLGAFLSLDLAMLQDFITDRIDHMVLYGKELYPKLFEPLLKERFPNLRVSLIDESDADILSAKGAVKLYSHAVQR